MLSKKRTVFLLVLVGLMVIAALVTYHIHQERQAQERDVAKTLGTDESVQYTSFGGEAVALEQFDDRVRVVNSWASWSPHSRAELPRLDRLAEEYADQGVAVIAINRNEDPARAERFVEKLDGVDNIQFLMDGEDIFYDRTGGYAMPETLFYDTAGNIVKHVRGDMSYEEMVTHVEAALNAQ